MARQNRAGSRVVPARETFDRAVALQTAGKHDEAAALYRRAIEADPGMASAHNNLGAALGRLGRHAEAVEHLRRAVELHPEYFEAWVNLALALESEGRRAEEVVALQRAQSLRPEHLGVLRRLGSRILAEGRYEEASAVLEGALEVAPEDPELVTLYAEALSELRRFPEAIRLLEGMIEAGTATVLSYNLLGNCARIQGRMDASIDAYRKALELEEHVTVRSNLLLSLNYVDSLDPREVAAEHALFGEIHERGVPLPQRYSNHRDPERRLRVGYLSPDLRQHSVAHFVDGVLREHDPRRVEVFCYSDAKRSDEVTDRFRRLASEWRDTEALSDRQLIDRIRADEVDVLVELAGHTAGGRPRVLARKPAPIQISYLGYPNTTGLRAVDYRITDGIADPDGETEALHTEELIRLPGGFLCYTPMTGLEEPSPPPCLRGGGITFGSFNLLAKMGAGVVEVWARVLHRVPGSRLLLKSAALGEEETRARVAQEFLARGISGDRLELVGHLPRRRAHFDLYAQVDVALDPFPYNGTTTTCEALWMGVPVVTLAGRQHVGRVGASLMTAIGRPGWVAGSEEEYVEIAARLASSAAELASIRFALRHRMSASPLMDASRIARELEAAYRRAWRRWCEASPTTRP